jgi:hypothetical protein
MDDESGAWLSYAEVADRLGVTPEAARSRAKRLGWRRQLGNDGKALVWAALEPRPPGDGPVTPRSPPARKAVDPALVTALQAHNETLKGDIEALRAQLELAGGELQAERARTSAAISAFADLADRLDQLAAERAKPWWRRLTG